MHEPYFIIRGDMYLHGFSPAGNPIWTMQLDEALWLEEELARKWIRCLHLLFDISNVEIDHA